MFNADKMRSMEGILYNYRNHAVATINSIVKGVDSSVDNVSFDVDCAGCVYISALYRDGEPMHLEEISDELFEVVADINFVMAESPLLNSLLREIVTLDNR